jgi:hypothetical protein
MTRFRASGVNRLFLLDATADMPYELEIERQGEATGDLALRFREVAEVGLEPVGPDMRNAFRINQLHIHPNIGEREASTNPDCQKIIELGSYCFEYDRQSGVAAERVASR